MGNDILQGAGLGTGIAGAIDTGKREDEARAANEGQFDTAEGRQGGLRGRIEGDPNLQGVPQDTINLARAQGKMILKRPDGSYAIGTRDDLAGLIEADGGGAPKWLSDALPGFDFGGARGEIIDPGRGPGIHEIAKTGVEDFQDIREDVMGRFADLESTLIPGLQQREQDIMGGFNEMAAGLGATAQARTDTGMGRIDQLMQSLQGGFGQLQSDVAGGFGTLRGDLLSALEGSGDQERLDINEQFSNLGDATQAGLVSSGLSGSTINPSLQAGVQRQRSGALGRLDERLRQQELGAIGSTGFGALGAQQNIGLAGLSAEQGLGQFGAGLFSQLSGDALGLGERLGFFGTGLQESLSGDTFSAMERLGGLGIGLEAGTGEAVANAKVQFGQLPFGYDMSLTGSEVGLDLSQMTQAGVSPLLMLSGLLQSFIQPETPDQPGFMESIFPSLIGAGGAVGSAALLSSAPAVPAAIGVF